MPPICRHDKGDPNCGSSAAYREREYAVTQSKREKELTQELERLRKDLSAMTPRNDQYQILDVCRVGAHIVYRIKYESCTKCTFEGEKILVWLNVSESVAVRWRVIDPHFRPKDKVNSASIAPGPDARFPATDEGWKDALAYAQSKA